MGTAATPTFLLDRKWPFRVALAAWLCAGVAAWLVAAGLGRPAQVILGALWLVGLALLLRQFLLSLVGPVLAYDVLRVGRRRRQIWLRVAYAMALAFILTWVYFAWVSMAEFRGEGTVQPKQLAQLAETYFAIYMVVQFIIVCLMTPAAVAGAIAEEKERRTLEFLLATDLRDREILFGKLASRVGSLLLLLAAGLPILTLMQFFGGIDPDLVIAGFAATVLVVLTLAALSIAASVLSRKARDAIALTYLVAVAYVVLSIIIYVISNIPYLRWQIDDVFGYTITFDDLTYPLVAGNPFFLVPYVLETRAGRSLDLFTVLSHFALFHFIVIVLLVVWAGFRLRSIALRQTFGGGGRPLFRRLLARQPRGQAVRRRVRAPRFARPEVGAAPVLWKEVFVDSGLGLGLFGRAIIFTLIGLSYVPIGFIAYFALFEDWSFRSRGPWWSAERWDDLAEGMNGYLRAAGTMATSLVFLALAIRGSGAITGERDRHTLDMLLTTPLTARDIIWGKWWGCMLGMRWAWAWILSLWVLALATGGVHPVMFPAAVISIAAYASGFAWIGLYCSLHLRTSLRSTMSALFLSLFIGGGYFLLFVVCCAVPSSFGTGEDNILRVVFNFLCSFSPPVNVAWLPIMEFDDWELSFVDRDTPYAPFWLLGLCAWSFLSWALSRICVNKLRELANRSPVIPAAAPRRPSEPPPLPGRNDA